ncbi:MAG: cysteine desulfurase family protein [Acidimicrobiales bacterium]
MSAYLDHAATTPLRPEARRALVAALDGPLGNSTGAHRGARAARTAVEEARDVVAAALGCRPAEVVFTGGGTESDNLAVVGVIGATGGTAVCSAIEHHAVLDPVVASGGRTVGVDPLGRLDLDALADALDPTVALVSVMAANNEIGVVQDLSAIADVMRSHAPDAVLHTDAVQAVPWLDVAEVAAPAALVSVSAHKVGGPHGVGVLVMREGVRLAPLHRGGGQERDRRSGTHNVAGIVATAAALAATEADRADTVTRVGALRDRLADTLVSTVPGVWETAVPVGPDGRRDRSGKIAGSCHLCIDDIESEALLFLLDQGGVAASAASSCSSGALDPSHVLAALGIPRDRAKGSLRLSLGHTTTEAEVDHAIDVVGGAIERLRSYS